MTVRFREALVGLAVAAALVAFPVVDPNVYHTSVGIMIGVYTIVNLGLNLLLGNTGQISLGQAAFFGIGAYASGNITERVDWAASHLESWSFWIGTLGGVILAAAAGFLLGFLAVRLKGHFLAMATLGFQIIFSTVALEWYGATGGPGGFQISSVVRLGHFDFVSEARYFYLTWAFCALAFVTTRRLALSRVGRALHAIKEYEGLAEACAVSPTRYKLQVFTFAAALAGLAGSLYAHYTLSIGPASFSVHISLMLLVMIVVGGLGDAWGTVLGTALLYLLPEIVRSLSELESFSPGLRQALSDNNYHGLMFGVILAVFVLFVPRGLMGALVGGRRSAP